MSRINIGRALVLTGFLVGLTSLWATFSHKKGGSKKPTSVDPEVGSKFPCCG